MAGPRINFNGVTSLLVDSDNYTRGLVAQMLRGFGMDSPITAESGAAAQAILKHQCPDLCIFEGILPDMTSAELTRWIRHLKSPIRFVPVLVLTGYTQLRMVAGARDGGANIVVKKPVSPRTLFDRLVWIARVARPFIETKEYSGPDRRFRTREPPDGVYKRDTDDVSLTATSETGEMEIHPVAQDHAPKWMAK
jgi:CheY-like chemotaxis protein